MAFSYDKLWKRLHDNNMMKQDLRNIAGISRATVAKLTKNETVTTEVLTKICEALKCDISDIAEIVHKEPKAVQITVDEIINSNSVYGLNSFFSGIGGFDVAFERNGFRTKYLCEINPFCHEVLAKHWPHVTIAHDICEVQADTIPNSEVWSGGFPCQDISVARGASKRLGLDGFRSGLFFEFANLISQRNPRVVVIENVGGLYNSNEGRDFGIILQKMTSLGYAVAWRLLNSRYFGVPQSRPRVYLCCWKDSPTKALMAMFDKEGAHKTANERKGFITEEGNEGEYPRVPEVAYCLAATSGRHTGTDWSRTYVVCHDGVRRLTPIEYERLQGFPDNWTLPASYIDNDDTDTLRYTAIGNAVSVPVVEWLARRVHNLLDSSITELDKDQALSYVPEFRRLSWSKESLSNIDFTDVSQRHNWKRSGLAWGDFYVEGNVHPTPRLPIASSLKSLVQHNHVGRKYYLTANAAEGILRRVDNQGRKLFVPLRDALMVEKTKGITKE